MFLTEMMRVIRAECVPSNVPLTEIIVHVVRAESVPSNFRVIHQKGLNELTVALTVATSPFVPVS